MADPADVGHGSRLVQVGWISRETGVMCDCPVYELSPHANSDPVYKEVAAASLPVGHTRAGQSRQ